MIQYLGMGILLVVLAGIVPFSGFSLKGDEGYASGYAEGCYGAQKNFPAHSRRSDWASGHATVFMGGYYDGYRDCNDGTGNWSNLCVQIQWALVKGCGAYVNPDYTLTAEGLKAKNCIVNNAPLYGADLSAMKNAPDIVRILKPALAKSDCSNIINWGLLQTTGVNQVDNFLKVLGVG
jgi:hypothetical protein